MSLVRFVNAVETMRLAVGDLETNSDYTHTLK